MSLIVNKFGGAIMGSDELLCIARQRVQEQIQAGNRPIVVVSAFYGVTNKLTSIVEMIRSQYEDTKKKELETSIQIFIDEMQSLHYKKIETHIKDEERKQSLLIFTTNILEKLEEDLITSCRFGMIPIFQARILAYGEKLSSLFFTSFLEEAGIAAQRFKDKDIGIITKNNDPLDGNIDWELSKQEVKKNFQDIKLVPVVMGFTGRNNEGQLMTLGRGGSDTTACFLGSALAAKKIILWKEVDGVLSADPRIIPQAKTVAYISYQEAEESGKVLCDKAIEYLENTNTPAEVASIYDEHKKTTIGPVNPAEEKGVKIMSVRKNIILITVSDIHVRQYGFLYKITDVLNHYKINMALIRNTRDSLYIAIEARGNEGWQKALDDLKAMEMEFHTREVDMVNVIGNLDVTIVEKFNKLLFNAAPDAPMGAFPYHNCVRLEALVKDHEVEKMLQVFHETFVEKK